MDNKTLLIQNNRNIHIMPVPLLHFQSANTARSVWTGSEEMTRRLQIFPMECKNYAAYNRSDVAYIHQRL